MLWLHLGSVELSVLGAFWRRSFRNSFSVVQEISGYSQKSEDELRELGPKRCAKVKTQQSLARILHELSTAKKNLASFRPHTQKWLSYIFQYVPSQFSPFEPYLKPSFPSRYDNSCNIRASRNRKLNRGYCLFCAKVNRRV